MPIEPMIFRLDRNAKTAILRVPSKDITLNIKYDDCTSLKVKGHYSSVKHNMLFSYLGSKLMIVSHRSLVKTTPTGIIPTDGSVGVIITPIGDDVGSESLRNWLSGIVPIVLE